MPPVMMSSVRVSVSSLIAPASIRCVAARADPPFALLLRIFTRKLREVCRVGVNRAPGVACRAHPFSPTAFVQRVPPFDAHLGIDFNRIDAAYFLVVNIELQIPAAAKRGGARLQLIAIYVVHVVSRVDGERIVNTCFWTQVSV